MGTNLLHQYQSTVAEGASSGTPGGLVGPNEWNAGHQLYLDVNGQTGTSYTIAAADDGATLTFNNSSAVAVTLPQAQAGAASIGSALGFYRGWFCFARNLGAGDVTITPATSTINGSAKLILKQYEQAIVVSDGTNYQALPIRWDVVQQDGCYRGKIVPSVSGNALTVALKTLSGDDPSPADPVLFFMRSVSPQSGDVLVRVVTAALSIVAPSGASFGHVSGRDQQLIAGCLDNAGTIELTLSTKLFDQSVRLQSSSAIGAGSTDPATLFSTNARSNLAWKPLARLVSNQTTAGTWANGPSASAPGILRVDAAPFVLPTNACRTYLGANQTGIANDTETKANLDTVDFDPDGISDVSTNHRIQPKVPGTYLVSGQVSVTGTSITDTATGLAKNGTIVLNAVVGIAPHNTIGQVPASTQIQMNGTSDYLEIQGYGFVGSGTVSFNSGLFKTFLSCVRVGP